jgi:hypothetical protein
LPNLSRAFVGAVQSQRNVRFELMIKIRRTLRRERRTNLRPTAGLVDGNRRSTPARLSAPEERETALQKEEEDTTVQSRQ